MNLKSFYQSVRSALGLQTYDPNKIPSIFGISKKLPKNGYSAEFEKDLQDFQNDADDLMKHQGEGDVIIGLRTLDEVLDDALKREYVSLAKRWRALLDDDNQRVQSMDSEIKKLTKELEDKKAVYNQKKQAYERYTGEPFPEHRPQEGES